MITKKVMIAVALLIVLVGGLLTARGWISSRAYYRAAGRLHSSMPAELQAKYGDELEYTIDKFWNCYDEGICSRNDMTDVMDRMKQLISGGEITDMAVFDFIGFVSRLYTDRFDGHHQEEIRRMEEERALQE